MRVVRASWSARARARRCCAKSHATALPTARPTRTRGSSVIRAPHLSAALAVEAWVPRSPSIRRPSRRRRAPASPVAADAAETARRTHDRVATIQAVSGHALVTEGEVELDRVGRVDLGKTGGDLLGHAPVPRA